MKALAPLGRRVSACIVQCTIDCYAVLTETSYTNSVLMRIFKCIFSRICMFLVNDKATNENSAKKCYGGFAPILFQREV